MKRNWLENQYKNSPCGSHVHNCDVLLEPELVIVCLLLIPFMLLYSLISFNRYFWYCEILLSLLFVWPIKWIFTTSSCPVHQIGHTISLFLSFCIPLPKSMSSRITTGKKNKQTTEPQQNKAKNKNKPWTVWQISFPDYKNCLIVSPGDPFPSPSSQYIL